MAQRPPGSRAGGRVRRGPGQLRRRSSARRGGGTSCLRRKPGSRSRLAPLRHSLSNGRSRKPAAHVAKHHASGLNDQSQFPRAVTPRQCRGLHHRPCGADGRRSRNHSHPLSDTSKGSISHRDRPDLSSRSPLATRSASDEPARRTPHDCIHRCFRPRGS
ncbi:hypothetical protein [Lysobacter gummosus]|uniref:hypothetical protein n=1 Tax=Lysobacter gummosus TaxID=262324 RepID=UPI0036443275